MRIRDAELEASIAFQRLIIRDMNQSLPEQGSGAPAPWRKPECCSSMTCCKDSATGALLTFGEFFDHHARVLAIIDEFEEKFHKE